MRTNFNHISGTITSAAASGALLVGFAFAGCVCGDIVVTDPFAVVADEGADSLHTYATGSRVPLTVKADFDVDAFNASVNSGRVENLDDKDDDRLTFDVIGAEAGEVELSITGEGAELVRTLVFADVDALALAVTAPEINNVVLPSVDPADIRIHAGGRAAFRTTMLTDGDEIFGLEAVTATPDDTTFTTRACTGCAPDTCDAVRGAMEIAVPAAATAPSDVVLTAGNATLTTTVVPTPEADITDVTLEPGDNPDGTKSIVAHVLAGTEPVFGAPVTWTIDGDALLNDNGDAEIGDVLQFDDGETQHDVEALIGARTIATTASGEGFKATSITGACGASGAAAPAGALALGLLVACRSRQRRADGVIRGRSGRS